jgi:tetratricopeptide repeat protein 21B
VALQIIILYHLCREAKYAVAASKIEELRKALLVVEPKNHLLFYHCAKPFSRLAARSPAVLQQTMAMMDVAMQLSPQHALYRTEYANQLCMLGKLSEALVEYKKALDMDETEEETMNGIISTQIELKEYDDASKQLEFLNEIQQGIGKNSSLLYLGGLLMWRRDGNRDKALKLLAESIDIHFRSLQTIPLGLEYYSKLNPDFLMTIVSEFMSHAKMDPLEYSSAVPLEISKAIGVLEIITKAIPGHAEASFRLAKCKLHSGNVDGARRELEKLLKMNVNFTEAQLLMAEIQLKQNQPSPAAQTLDIALSQDFEVRENPYYFILKSKIHTELGEIEEAIKTLEEALNLPGVKTAQPTVESTPDGKSVLSPSQQRKAAVLIPQISLSLRVSVFIQLSNLYVKRNQTLDAANLMKIGEDEFRNTAEQPRFHLANAQIAMARGEPQMALEYLQSIRPANTVYAQAQMMMANIHLVHKNDRKMYIQCYKRLADLQPSKATMVHLGDAFIKIQEPEKGIKMYQQALDQADNNEDVELVMKVGKAMITTHEYGKAIEYFQTILEKNPDLIQIRRQFADLLIKLKKFDLAEKILIFALETRSESSTNAAKLKDVSIYLLLQKVHSLSGNSPRLIEVLTKARDLQLMILEGIRGEGTEATREQRKIASEICFHLAEAYRSNEGAVDTSIAVASATSSTSNNMDRALALYNEALRYNEANEKSLMALAKLHNSKGDLDNCQHHCITLLRLDPGHEESAMMLADLMFKKSEYDAATFHFQQLLERKPNHYSALARLVGLLRRAGKLSEVPRFLKLAETLSKKSFLEPGLQYCKGLFHRYTNQPREALTAFYASRRDPDYNELATIQMIEIYLNPDNETMLGELPDEESATGTESEVPKQPAQDNTKAVQSARDLLRDLSGKKSLKFSVLNCYAQMASKLKPDVEESMSVLVNITNQDRNYVPAILALAQAHILRKETPKARNQLKRISKMAYNSEEAEEFERSWLMLADIYIQTGKFDTAQELLKKCLNYNKSCAKAWELMGYIMEKEQSYRDAADHYEFAWKMENESNPSIGFRLAFNYLKAKRYVEAIEICHKVLKKNPDFPKIKVGILDRARLSVRS